MITKPSFQSLHNIRFQPQFTQRFLALLLMNLDLLYIILVIPTRHEEESLHNIRYNRMLCKDPSLRVGVTG